MPAEFNGDEHPIWCAEHDADGYHRSASVTLPQVFGVTTTAAIVQAVNPEQWQTAGAYLDLSNDRYDGAEYDADQARHLLLDLTAAHGALAALVAHLDPEQVTA